MLGLSSRSSSLPCLLSLIALSSFPHFPQSSSQPREHHHSSVQHEFKSPGPSRRPGGQTEHLRGNITLLWTATAWETAFPLHADPAFCSDSFHHTLSGLLRSPCSKQAFLKHVVCLFSFVIGFFFL